MVDLQKEIKYVKGVGPNRALLLNRLGIYTLKDLITYYPRTHEDRSIPKNIIDLLHGEEALIEAMPVSRMSEIRIRKNFTMYKLIVRDETGTCQITWYNQPYLKTIFKTGHMYRFFGKVNRKYKTTDIESPVFDEVGNSKNTGKIIPIYPTTYNLPQNTLRKIIETGLSEVDEKLEDTLPKYLTDKYKLCNLNTAIKQIHFPDNFEKFNIARKRLVFEELLSMQLALLSLKSKVTTELDGISLDKNVKMSEMIDRLPFKLTKAQLKVLEEIDNDLEDVKPMNRLLQGDVGSRKDCCSFNCNI